MTAMPAQPSDHDESPRESRGEDLSPADSLALIDAQRRHAEHQLRPNPLGLYLPWGLAYLVGFGAVWLAAGPGVLTATATAVIVALCFLGAVTVGTMTLARSMRGVAGPTQAVGRRYGWSWPLGFVALGIVNSQLAGLGLPGPVMSLIWSGSALILVGVLTIAGGLLWPGSGQYALGVWILISAALSVFVGYPANFLVLALAGGGGFVALALTARLRGGRTA